METKTKKENKAIERKINKILDEYQKNKEALLKDQEALTNDTEDYKW